MCYKNICARRQQIAEALRLVKKKSADPDVIISEVMGRTGKCFQ